MAYLNVRARRIETKIAYVGPQLAGKATNLRQLGVDSARGRSSEMQMNGDILSLEWRPLQGTRFQDCDVAVKLVAPKGSISQERLDVVLEDADGIVVVVDAAPSARDENLRALSLVRDHLSRSSTPLLPVVVQLNKTDLADALPVTDVGEALGWPIVAASAARGEGVVETLEMAVENVVESFKKKERPFDDGPAPPAQMDQNPLLSALRDILRETVAEHMADVEAQAARRIAESVAVHLGKWEQEIDELRRVVVTSAEATARALAAQKKDVDSAIRELVTRRDLEATTRELVTGLDLAAAVSELVKREDLDASTRALVTREQLFAHEEKIRGEVATCVRVEREQFVSVVKRSVDALSSDMKKEELRIANDVSDLHEKVDAMTASMGPVAASVGGVPARLGTLEVSLQRELREAIVPRLSRLEDFVQGMNTHTGESMQRVDQRAGEIQNGLNELLEELKRRKKGWFS